jgi:glycosyltransferase involved in cell wall biosynthesis
MNRWNRALARVRHHGGIGPYLRNAFRVVATGDVRLVIKKIVALVLDKNVVTISRPDTDRVTRPFVPDQETEPVEAKVVSTFAATTGSSADLAVSIVIPCYQQGQFLSDALSSVAASTSRRHQCVVVDDGNSFTSQLALLDQLIPAAEHQELVIIRQPNQGVAAARNAGLKTAQADTVLFLDADDFLSVGALDVMLESLEASGADVVIGDTFHWSSVYPVAVVLRPVPALDNKEVASFLESVGPIDIIRMWERGLSIPIHSALFTRKALSEFDVALRSKEDLHFWIRFFARSNRASYLDQTVCVYRQHESQSTKVDDVKNGFYFLEAIRCAVADDVKPGVSDLRNIIDHVKAHYGAEIPDMWCDSSGERKSSPLGAEIAKAGHIPQ